MNTVWGYFFGDFTIELIIITVSRFSQDFFPFIKQKIFSARQEGDSPFTQNAGIYLNIAKAQLHPD